jgi:hypothetical protein
MPWLRIFRRRLRAGDQSHKGDQAATVATATAELPGPSRGSNRAE